MKTFTKKYQLWTYVDSAYTFKEFDTLAECIAEPKYSEWYITKGVTIAVTEATDIPGAVANSAPLIQMTTAKDLIEKTDEEKQFERDMSGRIAPLG